MRKSNSKLQKITVVITGIVISGMFGCMVRADLLVIILAGMFGGIISFIASDF